MPGAEILCAIPEMRDEDSLLSSILSAASSKHEVDASERSGNNADEGGERVGEAAAAEAHCLQKDAATLRLQLSELQASFRRVSADYQQQLRLTQSKLHLLEQRQTASAVEHTPPPKTPGTAAVFIASGARSNNPFVQSSRQHFPEWDTAFANGTSSQQGMGCGSADSAAPEHYERLDESIDMMCELNGADDFGLGLTRIQRNNLVSPAVCTAFRHSSAATAIGTPAFRKVAAVLDTAEKQEVELAEAYFTNGQAVLTLQTPAKQFNRHLYSSAAKSDSSDSETSLCDDNADGSNHSNSISSSGRKQQYLSMAALFEAANSDTHHTVLPGITTTQSDSSNAAISTDESFTKATQTDWSILPTVNMQYSTMMCNDYSPLVEHHNTISYHHQSYNDGEHDRKNDTSDDDDDDDNDINDTPSTPSMQHTSSVTGNGVDTSLPPSSGASYPQLSAAHSRPNSNRARQSCMITPGKSCMSTATSGSKSVQWSRQLTERFSPQFDDLSPITARAAPDQFDSDNTAAASSASAAADSIHSEASSVHASAQQADEHSWANQHSNDSSSSLAKSLFTQTSATGGAALQGIIAKQHAQRDASDVDAIDDHTWHEHNDGSATFTIMASLSLNSSYRRLSTGSLQIDAPNRQQQQQQHTAVQHAAQRSADTANHNRNINDGDDADDVLLSQWTGFLGSPHNIENQQSRSVLYSRSVKDTSDRLLVSSNSSSPLSWQGSPVSTYTNTRQAIPYSDHQRSPLTDISLSESTEYWRQRLRAIDRG
eukprot:15413-Heterococcus_DN1.PRE.1